MLRVVFVCSVVDLPLHRGTTVQSSDQELPMGAPLARPVSSNMSVHPGLFTRLLPVQLEIELRKGFRLKFELDF